tara:strand:+ start:8220 stop:8753 length:534 start_codon:yes stop_codon:yes gene_type:complete
METHMLRLVTKTFSLTALTALSLSASAALAEQPVMIAPIQIGEELAAKADDLGTREFERLSSILLGELEDELAPYLGENGSVLRVTILDATPNRPTMAQMAARPGLSMESFGIGGASLEAELVSSEGDELESYSYAWHSYNIVDARHASTWSDARRTFSRFASQIGESIAERIADGS